MKSKSILLIAATVAVLLSSSTPAFAGIFKFFNNKIHHAPQEEVDQYVKDIKEATTKLERMSCPQLRDGKFMEKLFPGFEPKNVREKLAGTKNWFWKKQENVIEMNGNGEYTRDPNGNIIDKDMLVSQKYVFDHNKNITNQDKQSLFNKLKTNIYSYQNLAVYDLMRKKYATNIEKETGLSDYTWFQKKWNALSYFKKQIETYDIISKGFARRETTYGPLMTFQKALRTTMERCFEIPEKEQRNITPNYGATRSVAKWEQKEREKKRQEQEIQNNIKNEQKEK